MPPHHCSDGRAKAVLSFLDDLSLHAHGMIIRLDVTAAIVGVDLGKLGPEQQNLRRIVNPQEQGDERAGRAVGISRGAAPEVKTEGPFAETEK